ncbi:hypothetical protein DYI95_011275 [Thermaerobacter sp. PB12/4term]|uniref:hypothetical protein n=1 Tax=Thermaerobacter sp. PB12/4term TaxID=2293838 RepID=UPI000E327EA3|nr:hypothetical protein [Thermaerobacter sp. PB12/4term]QIA28010.1 hypothetical protein DYI95_011275 [Thermaerobacter sp. PB12/4term]
MATLGRKSRRRPLRVEIVGLFPLIYKMCPRGMGWGAGCGLEWPADQTQDYPPEEQARQRQLESLVAHLAARFGWRLQVVTVPLTSLRGMWLATRYGIGTGQVALVAAGRCVRLDEGYEAIDRLLASCLGEDQAAG